MAQEIITLECTEAKALGKPTSRYMTTRNKKSPRTRAFFWLAGPSGPRTRTALRW